MRRSDRLKKLDAEVQHLYVDRRLTTEAIAGRFGCSTTTVRRRLFELGVPIRPRGPSIVNQQPELEWSHQLAYAFGVIATDGSLSQNGRHLIVSSKDRDFLETVRRCLGVVAPIVPYANGAGAYHYHIQWSDRRLYDWLIGIGLMPNKSLRLGPVTVPDTYFSDFVRGCIDGDGSIVTYTDRYHTTTNAKYVYERLSVSLVSGSLPFLEWMCNRLKMLVYVLGHICAHNRNRRRPLWQLKYGKADSIRLLEWMYYASDVPCLTRKRQKALQYFADRKSHLTFDNRRGGDAEFAEVAEIGRRARLKIVYP